MSCNGKQVVDWTGDSRRLNIYSHWEIRDPRHVFLAGYNTPYEISKLELSPLAAESSEPCSTPRFASEMRGGTGDDWSIEGDELVRHPDSPAEHDPVRRSGLDRL